MHSRMVQRVERRFPATCGQTATGADFSAQSLAAELERLREAGYDETAALRWLRQCMLARLCDGDVNNDMSLESVTGAMTDLAQFCINAAYAACWSELQARHGTPRADDGQVATLWVVGMGKLGARELNVSSDIDLVYVYDHDGMTDGAPLGTKSIENREFFSRMAKGLQRWLADVTDHGFVFRMDLALRPNGQSGPVACSLDALAEYFLVQGREWERMAWMKSRVVAPTHALTSGSAQALRDVVLPFVYRKYLDYGVFESLRVLRRQIREHALRRAAGRPERTHDVKLGRGGIREIEFIVQLLQVVRGGHFPELRTRGTLKGLDRLVQLNLLAAPVAHGLQEAYIFMRRLEHRIQYLDDAQTHTLPTDDTDLAWVARAMGVADACELLCVLDAHRELVASEFDQLLGGAQTETEDVCKGCKKPPSSGGALRPTPGDATGLDADSNGIEKLRQSAAALQASPRALRLNEAAALRLDRLCTRAIQWCQQGRAQAIGVIRSFAWMEQLLRRESYVSMLWERPQVHERLLRLFAAAPWPAQFLARHPAAMDELANAHWLDARFDASTFTQELQSRYDTLVQAREDDEETLMDTLRRAHQAELLRTLTRDLERRLSVEQVADDLSALADATLQLAAHWAWARCPKRHLDISEGPPRVAIVAYGKLGGKELGYGSDLDLVFLYDDEHPQAQDAYAAWVRRLISWLSAQTGTGRLFDIDTALRPNGNAGLLISSMETFAQYQSQRGSNAAWTWEHQAITRARWCAGDLRLKPAFDAVRQNVLQSHRDASALCSEILAMRERVRAAHAVRDQHFDLKHGEGAMVDVEFAVQYLVLTHAAKHPSMCANVGNIALLGRAQDLQLLPEPLGQSAGDAYRELRRAQHTARLDERSTQLPEPLTPSLTAARQTVLHLWAQLFTEPPP